MIKNKNCEGLSDGSEIKRQVDEMQSLVIL